MTGEHRTSRHLPTQCWQFKILVVVIFAITALPLPTVARAVELTAEARPLQNSLFDSPTEFLPVDKAYQLTPRVEDQELVIDWLIAPGYYLYKHQFSVVLEDKAQTTPLTLRLKSGKRIYDEIFEKELEVYYATTQIRARLPVDGVNLHTAKVVSQGCADAGLCYPPRTHYLQINRQTGAIVALSAPPFSADTPTGSESAVRPSENLILLIVFALIGGMILNLMPCVFPVLSIKVMSTAAAHLNGHNKHIHGLAYSSGIILSFLAIAAILAALKNAGQVIGWGFQLQSPIFVGLLAYLFFVIAQSFAGHLTIAGRWMNIGQAATQSSSVTGSFFTGVLATVVASPCTAPFMGTALGVALTQSSLVSTAVFAALGLGLALPFLALSWIPGLLEKLPAPGPWMQTFSQLLAFPLYASVIWLLWVLGRQAGIDHAVVVTLGILLLGFAIWLNTLSKKVTIKGLAIIAVAAALYLVVTPTSRPAEHLWQPYSADRLAALREQGRAVFINLTADWCVTCLANEKIALSSAAFETALIANDVTYLKGDWTNRNSEITELLSKHGRGGVPLYLFYDAAGSPPEILPQLLTKHIVLRTLEQRE